MCGGLNGAVFARNTCHVLGEIVAASSLFMVVAQWNTVFIRWFGAGLLFALVR